MGKIKGAENMKVLLDKNRFYLDYNATTPPAEFLKEKYGKWLFHWGNPSSVHQKGQKARHLWESAKKTLAEGLSCHPLELVVCGSGSEANNQAIKGFYSAYFAKNPKRNEIIMSAVEHPSVKAPMEYLKQKGLKLHIVPVSQEGLLDEDFYQSVLSSKTFLVSMMYANNETGHIFPIKKLAKMAKDKGAFFHCDAVQVLGKCPFQLSSLSVDTASFSAHKFYALKGTGLLYLKKGIFLESLVQGGAQERKRRAGTENVLGLVGLSAVMEKKEEILSKHLPLIKNLRDKMEQEILSCIRDVRIVGAKNPRLPNTSCLIIKGVEGETLLMNMDLKGFSFSVGSACHSGSLSPSAVLTAMGYSESQSRSAVRLSLGLGLKDSVISNFVSELKNSVDKIRSF